MRNQFLLLAAFCSLLPLAADASQIEIFTGTWNSQVDDVHFQMQLSPSDMRLTQVGLNELGELIETEKTFDDLKFYFPNTGEPEMIVVVPGKPGVFRFVLAPDSTLQVFSGGKYKAQLELTRF